MGIKEYFFEKKGRKLEYNSVNDFISGQATILVAGCTPGLAACVTTSKTKLKESS